MKTHTQRGFTLYELLVTMLVAGIILGLGVPNLLEFSRNNRMTATANDLQTALMLARSEAVKQRNTVTLCASPNPVAATPTCSPDGSGTAGGYIVWNDDDADAVVDGGETILLQRDDPQDITVFGDSGYVHFGINGSVVAIPSTGEPAASAVLFCDSRGNVVVSGSLSAARGIRISRTGSSHVLRETAEITALGSAPTSLTCP